MTGKPLYKHSGTPEHSTAVSPSPTQKGVTFSSRRTDLPRFASEDRRLCVNAVHNVSRTESCIVGLIVPPVSIWDRGTQRVWHSFGVALPEPRCQLAKQRGRRACGRVVGGEVKQEKELWCGHETIVNDGAEGHVGTITLARCPYSDIHPSLSGPYSKGPFI